MKTSTLQVQEMLSVWSVDEVEKRIGEVPGVESVTVDFAGGRATVRYDETRLDNADIKSTVRQRGFESAPTQVASAAVAMNQSAAPTAPAAPLSGNSPMPAAAPASPDQTPPVKGESGNAAVSAPVEALPPEGDVKTETAEPHSHGQ